MLDIIKQAAVEAVREGRPASVLQGEVVSIDPLKIKVEQKSILPASFFTLTRAVTDHYVDISVSHITENRAGGSGDPAFESHNHGYAGRKKIIIHNGLRVGECVHLLQVQGGQQYIVLDRVHEPITKGQWL